jgi:molybdenum-dependent DNA-binding transcriptional regulator ModE
MIRPLADVQKDAILEAILATGSIAQAAIKLDISRTKIQRILKKHGLTLKVTEIRAELSKQPKLL